MANNPRKSPHFAYNQADIKMQTKVHDRLVDLLKMEYGGNWLEQYNRICELTKKEHG